MLSRDQDPPPRTDEPFVKRWPRAPRLIFLLLAGAGCWLVVLVVGWLAWRQLFS